MKTAILCAAQFTGDRPSAAGHGEHVGQGEWALCDIRWSDGALRVRAFGQMERNALLETTRAISIDPRFNALQVLVVDFLDIAEQEESFLGLLEDLLAILLKASFDNPHVQIAVMARDPYIVELADAMVRFGHEELPSIHTFDDRKKAADWIGFPPQL